MFQVFKLNFDGDSRGNPGPTSNGGVYHDSTGRILKIYNGAIGIDINDSIELEGLIQVFECMIREGWLPTIIKGYSNILIHMARCLANGRTSEIISSS